jgi:hypothetical protein
MQDFAPFIPERPPAIKGAEQGCLLLFNFILLLQNLLTSLKTIQQNIQEVFKQVHLD